MTPEARIAKLEAALRSLRTEELDQEPGTWAVKCISDHNAIIDEALNVESPNDILQGNAPGGGLVSITRRERDAMVARDAGKVVHIESSIAQCMCPDCQAREALESTISNARKARAPGIHGDTF